MMGKNKIVAVAITLVAILLLAGGCQNKPKPTASATGKAVINSLAPDFTTKNIITGQAIHLADYNGKLTLVNLWATWCPPCRNEIPSMNSFYQHYDGQVAIIAVSVDQASDNTVLNFANTYNMRFDVAHDDGTINGIYGTGSIPTTYIVNKEGVIVDKIIGGVNWDSPEVYAYFDKLLAK